MAVEDLTTTTPTPNSDHNPSTKTSTLACKIDDSSKIIVPPPHLPQPSSPQSFHKSDDHDHSLSFHRSLSSPETPDLQSLTKFIRARSTTLHAGYAAIAKRLSSLKSDDDDPKNITEFHLDGLKVTVRLKGEDDDDDNQIKGRITFFSRSGCRDCGAVRGFLREQGLHFVEINVDVFVEREAELVQLTGSTAVPAVFFNERFVGGLVVLNSLRNSGEFYRRLRDLAGVKCPETAPRPPVYGFGDEEKETADGMVGLVRVLRHRLPIQDRIVRFKLVKNCFSGSDLVEGIINHLDCGRKKAIEIGKELARKHFIHHVFRENDFEDGNSQFYRFLEHDPAIPRCFNFRGSTNDNEPKSAAAVGLRLTKLMVAILEAYVSDDRSRVDYARISGSEEFRRYVNLVQDLQRVDPFRLSANEKITFFLNLFNAMVIHAVIRIGQPGAIDRRSFYNDFQYIVGGYPYSLSAILNGILRGNRRQPYSLIKPFSANDKRVELAITQVNPLIHFGLCCGIKSAPVVRFFSPEGVDIELRYATREFFRNGGVEVDFEKRTVYLTKIIKWYSSDFGQDKDDILNWILNYLDATKAGLLTHLLNDGGQIHISYQNFDWSSNC